MGQKDRRQRARDERGSHDMPPHDKRERGMYGGEPYRQGYYGAEDVGNWSPYEARDPSGRGGFPSSWAGNERGGRMGWPRYGQGQGGYDQSADVGSYDRGGQGRREHSQGRRGSSRGEWQEWGGGQYAGDTGRDYGGDWRSQGQRDYGQRDYGQAGSWGYREQGSEAGPEHTTGAGWSERMGQDWRHEDGGGSGRMAGPYRGRGPRGYTRSDERIGEDVNDRLADDPYLDASEIEVGVSGGEVTLSGTVDSRQAKRRAEDLVDAISGVKHCQNNLRVREREEGGMARGGEESGKPARSGSARGR